MSGALDVVADIFDFIVDLLRAVVGMPPLPPLLVRLAFDQPPTVRLATVLRLEMRRAVHAFLRVTQGETVLFEGAPGTGGITIVPLTGALVLVHLRLESRHAGTARHGTCVTEAIFEPLPNGPPITIDVAPRVRLGEPLACGWHAPAATRVRLAVIEDGNVAERLEPPSGQSLVTPSRAGRLLLRLTAENEWGQTTVTRVVDVVPPKLRIALMLPAVQAGQPGEEVRFEWRASGADRVWLIAPDGKVQRVAAESSLCVTLGTRPAEFQVVARGCDGSERSVTLTAVPHPFAGLEASN